MGGSSPCRGLEISGGESLCDHVTCLQTSGQHLGISNSAQPTFLTDFPLSWAEEDIFIILLELQQNSHNSHKVADGEIKLFTRLTDFMTCICDILFPEHSQPFSFLTFLLSDPRCWPVWRKRGSWTISPDSGQHWDAEEKTQLLILLKVTSEKPSSVKVKPFSQNGDRYKGRYLPLYSINYCTKYSWNVCRAWAGTR